MYKIMIKGAKYEALAFFIKSAGKIAVAYSGGVDSSFLLAVSKLELDGDAVGITIDSPALPRYELEDAIKTASLIGARHIIIESPEIEEEIRRNPVNRCYFCKKLEFGAVIKAAGNLGITMVIDGSNVDDKKDFRPGIDATRELKVRSPLLELGFTKDEIRDFSKQLKLPTWDKPAYACLFSRIPYGQKINMEDLAKIENSEKFFIDMGYRTIRVRCHGPVARIEVRETEIESLFKQPFRNEIISTLKKNGFKYITVDLEGYRMGSLNESV